MMAVENSQNSGLFRRDEEFTQTTFALKFFPMHALSDSRRKHVLYNKFVWMTKKEIEELCNEDKNKLFYETEPSSSSDRAMWNLVWINNNMPSERAWNLVSPESRIFVELRVTRQWGRVALLSFGIASRESSVANSLVL